MKSKKGPSKKKKPWEIIAQIGGYLLAIAAILGGIQAIISKLPSKSPDPLTRISSEDFCPNFFSSIEEKNNLLVVLGTPEDKTPEINKEMAARLLDNTTMLGAITFTFSPVSDQFTILDVTDDKCVATNQSEFAVKNGEKFNVQLKENKSYYLLLKFSPDQKNLHIEFTK